MKYLTAMSGGVDSSVALALTRECADADFVCGITLALAEKGSELEESDRENIASAAEICRKSGVGHKSVYAYPEFSRRVIDYFVSEYIGGRTPNPCVLCNREIKLGLLADYAKKEGFDRIATGHYARLEDIGGYRYVRVAKDRGKDQSYVLAMLSQAQLRCAYFPLGEYTKAEVREIAESLGFSTARKKDSQDICFIPDGDYVSFIKRYSGYVPEVGDYIGIDGKILGKHKGQLCYTAGQRKGLGISLGKHAYVLEKDGAENTVVLGDECDLYKSRVHISSLNLPSDPEALDGALKCKVKLRYSATPADATVHKLGGNDALIELASPARAPTKGQFAVIYDESAEYILAAGVIVG